MNASEIQAEVNAGYYLGAISFALLFHEYFITLDIEVERYWTGTHSLPTVLFFLNRYVTLLGNIPVIVENYWVAPPTPQKIATCIALQSYHRYFFIVGQIIVGAMLMLRTYALYERSKRVAALMAAFSIAVVVVCFWSTLVKAGQSGDNLPLPIGCTFAVTDSQNVAFIISWAAMSVFDCMIFLLTLGRALTPRSREGTHLLTVLLRDGSIYFGVMMVCNVANILTFVLGGAYSRGVGATLTNIISSIMISRLMLNLRDPELRRRGQAVDDDDEDDTELAEFSTFMMSLATVVERPRDSFVI
ncbi:hypothetical protein FB45DRAFT_924136 [Roridomyces roridus]|uniref:DUF6533 domain-containing protein n=1 Tax=Roridomyces roridus TaxID=1738132 RepID=A0AAD7FHS3_9AGAR|nr:hypothetical protein FB45DRAFT_924136 [Roridomyces roridus]